MPSGSPPFAHRRQLVVDAVFGGCLGKSGSTLTKSRTDRQLHHFSGKRADVLARTRSQNILPITYHSVKHHSFAGIPQAYSNISRNPSVSDQPDHIIPEYTAVDATGARPA
jgi:hypothetical protein